MTIKSHNYILYDSIKVIISCMTKQDALSARKTCWLNPSPNRLLTLLTPGMPSFISRDSYALMGSLQTLGTFNSIIKD